VLFIETFIFDEKYAQVSARAVDGIAFVSWWNFIMATI
jgi:hypothetical protein